MTTIAFHLLAAFRSVVIIYKEKEPCKSAVKHSYKALMFTYRKELTPFMQRKKVQYFCTKPLLFFWWRWGESNPCPKTSWYNFLRVQSIYWIFSRAAPVLRLGVRATVFCVIGSTVNRRCTCTTDLTLSLGSWSFREERVTRRSQHCQLLSPEGSIIRQPYKDYYCRLFFKIWAV